MSEVATALLDRLTRVAGVRGALLVSVPDGLVVADSAMDDVDSRAVAALAASLYGRLNRAVGAGGLGPSGFVHLRASAGSLLIVPSGAELALVAVAAPDANVGLARLEMLDAAGQIG